jgi:hypothetical protein
LRASELGDTDLTRISGSREAYQERAGGKEDELYHHVDIE